MALTLSAWDGLKWDDAQPRFFYRRTQVWCRLMGFYVDQPAWLIEAVLRGLTDKEGSSEIPDWPPQPPDPPVENVQGPFSTHGVRYWVDVENMWAGFNIDMDAEPDVWMTVAELEASDIDPKAVAAIKRRMASYRAKEIAPEVPEDEDE